MKGSNLHTEGRHDPGLGILPKTKNKIKQNKKKKTRNYGHQDRFRPPQKTVSCNIHPVIVVASSLE